MIENLFLGPIGKRRARIERSQEKYLREKIMPVIHTAIKHKSVAVIVLPLFCQGKKFKLKMVK